MKRSRPQSRIILKQEYSMSAKNERITIKDVFLLGLVCFGLLSLINVLPDDSPVVSACILAAYALAGYLMVDRHK
jgi:hypothetical protein